MGKIYIGTGPERLLGDLLTGSGKQIIEVYRGSDKIWPSSGQSNDHNITLNLSNQSQVALFFRSYIVSNSVDYSSVSNISISSSNCNLNNSSKSFSIPSASSLQVMYVIGASQNPSPGTVTFQAIQNDTGQTVATGTYNYPNTNIGAGGSFTVNLISGKNYTLNISFKSTLC